MGATACELVTDYAIRAPNPAAVGKPLSLEYIADRIDLDDPIRCYVVRSARERWMQGFLTMTTFTTWHAWFRWDSLAPQANLIDYSDRGRGLSKAQRKHREWMLQRTVDADGSLARELRDEIFDGNPDTNGVIYPHIAELSLLGALGCGRFLVQAAIDEIESDEKSPYRYVVLQATEGSIPFYERMGFVRVGALCRHALETDSDDERTGRKNKRKGKGSPGHDDPAATAAAEAELRARYSAIVASVAKPPEKPFSAYTLYRRETFARVKSEAGPDAKFIDISRRVNDMWKALGDADKARLEAEADADRARYEREKSELPPDYAKAVRWLKKNKKLKRKLAAVEPSPAGSPPRKGRKKRVERTNAVLGPPAKRGDLVRLVESHTLHTNYSYWMVCEVSGSVSSTKSTTISTNTSATGAKSGSMVSEHKLTDQKSKNQEPNPSRDMLDKEQPKTPRGGATRRAVVIPLVETGNYVGMGSPHSGLIIYKAVTNDPEVRVSVELDSCRVLHYETVVSDQRGDQASSSGSAVVAKTESVDSSAKVEAKVEPNGIKCKEKESNGYNSTSPSDRTTDIENSRWVIVSHTPPAATADDAGMGTPTRKRKRKAKQEWKSFFAKHGKKAKAERAPRRPRTPLDMYLSAKLKSNTTIRSPPRTPVQSPSKKGKTDDDKAKSAALLKHRAEERRVQIAELKRAWQALPAEEKAEYEAGAREEEERFGEAYKKWKEKRRKDLQMERREIKRITEAGKPKRARPAQYFFIESAREATAAKNPDKSKREVAELLKAQWKELSTEDKEPFQAKAVDDEKRYETALAEWRRKTPQKPKILSAYLLYSQDERKRLKAVNPDLEITEISVRAGKGWNALSEEEKQPYKDQYEKDKVRFQKEKAEYQAFQDRRLDEERRRREEELRMKNEKISQRLAARAAREAAALAKKEERQKQRQLAKEQRRQAKLSRYYGGKPSPRRGGGASTSSQAGPVEAEPPKVFPKAVWGTIIEDQKYRNLPGKSSACRWYCATSSDTPKSIAARFGVDVDDLLFFNQRQYPDIQGDSGLWGGTALRIPRDRRREREEADRKAKEAEAQGGEAQGGQLQGGAKDTDNEDETAGKHDDAISTGTPLRRSTRRRSTRSSPSHAGPPDQGPPDQGPSDKDPTKRNETLQNENKSLMATPTASTAAPSARGSGTRKSSRKRRPPPPRWSGGPAGSTFGLVEQTRGPPIVRARENESIKKISRRLGLDGSRMLRANRKWYDGISLNAKLMRGTVLRVPGDGDSSDEAALPDSNGQYIRLEQFTEKSAYRHWAFQTDSLEHAQESYMMVRKLRRRPRGEQTPTQHVARCVEVTDQGSAVQTRQTFDPITCEPLPWDRSVESISVDSTPKALISSHNTSPNATTASDTTSKLPGASAAGSADAGSAGVGSSRGNGRNRATEPSVVVSSPTEPIAEDAMALPAGPPRRVSLRFRIGGVDLSLPSARVAGPLFLMRRVSRKRGHGAAQTARSTTQPNARSTARPRRKKNPKRRGSGAGGVGMQTGRNRFCRVFVRDTARFGLVHFPRGAVREAAERQRAAEEAKRKEEAKRAAERAAAAKAERLRLASPLDSKFDLIDKVVRISGAEHPFYFVLTYIPDLRWCRVAPMWEQGAFDDGAVRWKLMPEGQGLELDVSAGRCRAVRAVARVAADDADKEEWAIFDDEGQNEVGPGGTGTSGGASNSECASESATKDEATKVALIGGIE